MLIEQMIFDMLMGMFGNPLNIGIFLFVIFMAIGIFLRLGSDAMLVMMIPTLFAVFVFIPALRLIIGLGIGMMFGIAILKSIRG